MKLYIAPRAPSPRRVQMFMHEKGITGIELVPVDINAGEHRGAAYRARNPAGRVPALELDDGRCLSETRAICTYLEGLHPEPNLMGTDATERAFIEMADRQCEHYLMSPLAMWIRHGHPGLAVLEGEQVPAFAEKQRVLAREMAAIFDERLSRQPWMAGERFTIADITAFCAVEFARGLMKFKLAEAGYAHLAAWRDRMAARPSAGVA